MAKMVIVCLTRDQARALCVAVTRWDGHWEHSDLAGISASCDIGVAAQEARDAIEKALTRECGGAMLAALKEANAWNNADIRGFEDIAPNLKMLKARRAVLKGALRKC